jgi:hypothetical protein
MRILLGWFIIAFVTPIICLARIIMKFRFMWKLCCPLTTLLLSGELSNALITNFHSGQSKS